MLPGTGESKDMSRWHSFKESRFGRFLRRYWWAYPAFLVVKWGTIGALGYTAISTTQEAAVQNPPQSPGAALNLKAGDRLPDFSLLAWEPGRSEAVQFNSAALRGRQAFALFFYPLDDTPG